MKKIKIASVDIETWGELPEYALQPWRIKTGKTWLTMCCWVYGEGEELHHVDNFKESIRTHLNFCKDNDIYVTAWNAPYEAANFIALGLREEVMACKWLDGMLLYKNLINKPTHEERMSLSLKDAVRRYIPEHADYEENVDYAASPGTDVWDVLVHYNRLDTRFTFQLTQKFLAELPTLKPYLIEAASIPLIADAWVTGVQLDVPYMHKLKEEKTAEITKSWDQIQGYDTSITEEMLRSPTQMREKLYGTEEGQLGLDTTITTKKGSKSTNRLAMKMLREENPLTGAMDKWREHTGSVTKFIDGPLKSLEYFGDSTTHPSMKINSTYSRRMTIGSKQGKGKDERPTGIPLHQFPRKKEYRESIVATSRRMVVEFDASGQEFRWLAVSSGDTNMLQLCSPGEDAHCFLAAQVTGLDYRELVRLHKASDPSVKRPRDLGKTGNFGLSYGTSPPTFQKMALSMYDISISMQEARQLHKAYRKAYPGMPVYWEEQKLKVKNFDYVENVFGGRVNFDPNRYPRDGWPYVATSFNFPIQSAGAEQKYLGLAILKNILPEYDAKFFMDLHDGLYFTCPVEKAEAFAARGKKLLLNLPYKQLYNLTLPIAFPWDCAIGPNWGKMEKFDG